MFKNKGILIAVGVVFLLLLGITTTLYCLGQTVGRLESRFNIFCINADIERLKLTKTFALFMRESIEIDKYQLYAQELLGSRQSKLEEQLSILDIDTKKIDERETDRFQSANVILLNHSRGAKGSGTHIRLKNQDYIITCAHLIRNEKEALWAYDNDGREYPLKLVKVAPFIDLALFRINGGCPKLATLEIADIGPKRGSEVTIIGNPDGYEDIITDGVLTQENSVHYSFTNIIYFGNSGGAMLYRGKIVGVVVQLDVKLSPPFFVTYGKAVKLEQIKQFLGELGE